mgnify:CR=1 FL=1
MLDDKKIYYLNQFYTGSSGDPVPGQYQDLVSDQEIRGSIHMDAQGFAMLIEK